MTVDLEDKVLAAFQVESKEHLEGIRALLDQHELDQSANQWIDEAFRLAHSLKGGARVCNLRPAENLAHRLESVFERIRSEDTSVDAEVRAEVAHLLDGIEDWMADLDKGQITVPSPPPQEGQAEDEPGPETPESGLRTRLRLTFLEEAEQHIERLRHAVKQVPRGTLESEGWDEAIRLAHKLDAAALAAELPQLTQATNTLYQRCAELSWSAEPPTSERNLRVTALCDALASVEQRFDALRHPPAAPDQPLADNGHPPTPSQADSLPTGATTATETVRIRTDSLDGILDASRQLLAETVHQQPVDEPLREVGAIVARLQLERDRLRQVAAAPIQRMRSLVECQPVVHYLETVDTLTSMLTRQLRHLASAQKTHAWTLKTRGEEIQQKVAQARTVPAQTAFQGLRKLVRDLGQENNKQVELHVEGFSVEADRMVLQTLKDPLIHLLRNSVIHGVEPAEIRRQAGKSDTCRIDLRIRATTNRLTIEVEDDGVGLDRDRILQKAVQRRLVNADESGGMAGEDIDHLIFEPGLSTFPGVTEIAGRGVGLSVVKDAVRRLQGEVEVCPKPSPGTCIRMVVPRCQTTHRLLLVASASQNYAIPIQAIQRVTKVEADQVTVIEGRPVIVFEGEAIPLLCLTTTLGIEDPTTMADSARCAVMILTSRNRRAAVRVDRFLGEHNCLIQDLDEIAENRFFRGAILRDNGDVALVLHVETLLQENTPQLAGQGPLAFNVDDSCPPRRVLVVDDSFTTRTLERSILEANGYHVDVACDGAEGLECLQSESFDLVVSDVEMPRMDGFEMLSHIRSDRRLSSLPVILVTSRSHRDDQRKGRDLGADAYIVKQRFDHQKLLSTIRELMEATP